MPVLVVCPECGATTTLAADAPKGGTVPCRQCGIQLPVPEPKPPVPPPLPPRPAPATVVAPATMTAIPAPATQPPAPPPLPAAAAKGDTGFDVVEDDELDDAGRPAVGRRGRDDDDEDDEDDDDRPRSRRDRDDEDDDEDDRPRSRRDRDDEEEEDDDRPARSRRDRDDEDDEDDDRPARSRRGRNDEVDEDDGAPRRSARARDEDDEDDDDRPRRRDRDEEDDDEDDRRPAAREGDEDDDEDDRRRPAARDRDEDDEDDDDRRTASRAREDDDETPRRSARDEDDEDDDRATSRRRYADEDDDDDRPRKDRPSSKAGLLAVALLAFLVLGAGGAAAVYYFLMDDEKPVVTNDDNPPPDDDPGVKQGPQFPVIPPGKGPDVKGVPPFKAGPFAKAPVGVAPGGAWRHPPRDISIQPVRFTGERTTVNLPGPVSDVCAGGDGRYLFIHCPDDKKLLVFDVSSAQVVKELPTGGKDARFAAGATKLLLFDGIVRTLQRFDLVKVEKDKEVPLALPGAIRDIALGSGSRGPALVMTDAPADAWPVHFLDLDTLAPADVGWATPPPAGLPRDLRFKASANGSRWVGLSEAKDAKGAVLVSRDGKALTATRIAPDTALGFAALSADGRTLHSRFGTFPVQTAPPPKPPMDSDTYVLPAVTGGVDVRVAPGEAPETIQVTLGRGPTKGPVPKGAAGIAQPVAAGELIQPDKLVHYVADAHAVYVIQPSRKRIEVAKLNPFGFGPRSAAVTSTPPDRFTPGQPFAYPVRVLTNANLVTFVVGGPTGVQVSPDGIVRWAVPADEAREQVSLLVTVMTEGARGTQVVKLYNSAVPVPKATDPKKGPTPKKEPPKSPDPMVPTVAGAKLVKPATEKVPVPAAEMTEPHVEVPLPGQVRDVKVGGGGRYLVFHVPTARKLVVYDVSTLQVVKSLGLSTDDLLYAAGMDKLLVVYPTEKSIVRYHLPTLKTEADTVFESTQRPTFAAMGSGTAGPLILGNVPSQNNASKLALTFLDIESFKEVKIDKADGDLNVTTATAAHLRVSADGRTLGLWRAQLRPSGVQVVRLEGNTIKGAYAGDSAGEVTPGPDGQKVYTEQGAYALDARPDGPRVTIVPALQGTGHLTLSVPGAGGQRSVSVWGAAADRPLLTFDNLPGFDGKRDPFERDNPNLALDQRLFWVPDARVLIVVPPAAGKLHVYQVGAGKK